MITETLPYLISGMLFGLAAGATPGPLNTLVISETMRHGRKYGLMVAIAPILSDLPIILACIFVVASLEKFNTILGLISISGALYIAYLAYECFTVKGVGPVDAGQTPQSLRKGLIANFLNPNPYIFWLTIGATTIMSGYKIDIMAVVFFLASFYICIVGVKIIIAMIVDKFKSFLGSSAYLYILKAMGLALLVFAVIYAGDGLRLLGLI
jgi:threonine/homoserine/homoserine lactone efflux protein